MAALVNNVDVLVLHGSPGSGKSTLSGAIADLLRESGLANAVIDLDDLTMVYPHPERSFARNNLRAIWPNYATMADLRLVIPSVIADEDERVQLRAAVPGSRGCGQAAGLLFKGERRTCGRLALDWGQWGARSWADGTDAGRHSTPAPERGLDEQVANRTVAAFAVNPRM
ncbi:hypothetical protein KBX37_09630 [Micromonospora sp. U56]|uniref:hypothetical protein n=1 Tax=Micromonospora sp. U56 TaxID=2824900 RepID=UPI001B38337C|nr:hypothetical protein [Micromonospora sp. U56]MBQ0893354.1 hypothetical protein [Micromonospora sp. U56]